MSYWTVKLMFDNVDIKKRLDDYRASRIANATLFPNDYGAKRPSTQSDNEDMSECFKSLVQSQELDF
jgi:hypothetical protein